MRQVDIAEHFGVSRQTVGDWKRRGCPVGSADIGDVAGWKFKREVELAGVEVDEGIVRLVAEVERRKYSLEDRIRHANSLDPGLGKAAVVGYLMLEQALLDLPGRIMSHSPDELPEALFRETLHAHDAARGEGGGDDGEN